MVNWTADKDQIILKGIFKFHDIKSSAPLLKYLSEEIGGDCTPKAVSHRLTNIRKGGTIHANNGAVNSPTPKKSRSRARVTPRKKKAVSEEVESDGLQGLVDGEEEVLLNPTAACGKRGMSGGVKRKVEYKEDSDQEDGEGEDGVEEEYVPLAKRVKEELVEEAALVEELVDTEV